MYKEINQTLSDYFLKEILSLTGIPESIQGIIIKLIKTIMLLLIVKIVNKFVPKLVKKIIYKFSKYFGEEERKLNLINFLLRNIIRFAMYFFAIFKILDIFEQPLQPILAFSTVGTVVITFGVQSLVKDILTGLFILMEDQFFKGDLISIGNIKGVVERVGIRTTSIRSAEGDLHVVPNSEIKIVTNMSKDYRTVFLNLVVFYKENIDETIKILTKILDDYKKTSEDCLLESPNILGVTNITENDFTIRISANCKIGENFKVERTMRKFIKEKFDKKGINIVNI